MNRDTDATLAWMAKGTDLVVDAARGLDEAAYCAPSGLPGWSRKHVVAHLASNARALGRLLTWARTGDPTPMYVSPQHRADDIDAGAQLDAPELNEALTRSARELADAVEGLPPDAWTAMVVTATGRTVPAREIPWLRSREVMVHAVDLATGLTFADLPDDFLVSLRDDILDWRGREVGLHVLGDPAEVTAWLAGRPHAGVTIKGHPASDLPPWL